ncbi:MAG: hypothetical protein AB7K86_21745, partial [Rhodospirillales bacterium]
MKAMNEAFAPGANAAASRIRARLLPFGVAFAVAVGAVAAAQAAPSAVSDAITFSTQDQSLWGPGQEPLVFKPFTAPVINIDTGPQSIGEIADLSTTIPNPARLAYDTAFAACRVAFSATICRNGATIPFIGHVGGLGNAPPATLSVGLGKNGLKLSSDIDFEAGFKGDVTLDGGKVDVTVPTAFTLQADRSAYNPGEVGKLAVFGAVNAPTMTTEFSDLDLSLRAYADIDISAGIEAYVVGQGGGNATNIVNVDRYLEQELIGIGVGNSKIDLRLFGEQALELDTTGGIGANVFGIAYPNNQSLVKIPLADVQIQVPDLDTPPTSGFDGTSIVNTHYPIERVADENDLTLIGNAAGFNRTDVGKIDIDYDGVISAASISAGAPVVFGLSAGVTGIFSIEGNLLDYDLGAFLGFAQTMTFTPKLMAELAFSVPVRVKTASGAFEEVMKLVTEVGEEFEFIFPTDGFDVIPTYYLENVFSNATDFIITPVATISILQLKVTGLAADIFGIDADLALFQNAFPLADPIKAAEVFDDSFALEGFERMSGTPLHLMLLSDGAIGGDLVAAPEPAAIATMA